MSRVARFLGAVRVLVLGETVIVPAGVALLAGAALVLREVAPGAWDAVGGLALLAGALVIVVLSTRLPRG